MSEAIQPFEQSPREETSIAGAASLIALGNIASRVLGLFREMTIAYLFGASGLVSAFEVASRVPRMLFDLLIDGLVSSALVPVFSELAERDRSELWRVAGVMLSLTTLLMSTMLLVMEMGAYQIAWLMSGGFDAQLLQTTAHLMRLTAPAVVFLSLSGVTTGLLYALKRFTLPAFAVAIFNASLVLVALLLTGWLGLGIESLAVGMVVGSAAQVALQLPGLRDARLHLNVNLRHPLLRRIVRLYTPIVLGLVISQVGIVIDRNLASRTGEQSIAWMRYATTVVQFPLGLVSAAIAMAILPTLSRLANTSPVLEEKDLGTHTVAFAETLTRGIRMVLVLILPAVVGLFAIAEPLIMLVFQHGDFTAYDTQQTALALRLYLLGTTFAAIDLPLVFAFYARQNTLTPALVGMLGVGVYLVVALAPSLFRALHMTDLVLANSAQLTVHAMVMLWLTHREVPLRGYGLEHTLVKIVPAALAMGALTYFVQLQLHAYFPGGTILDELCIVAGAVIAGCSVYGGLLLLLRVEEAYTLLALMRRPFLGWMR
ncbi:MAG: murein biosynthesis integral membrane protein MurJ [Anaerolineae bacterium]|nr:murein biosynthesis integral membrane protein MurJ [Anaerolineae bacterium]MDW8070352.1 murein biosynthesis integral membrane protein MurJ [Anaerolineae bacterium]